MITAIPLNNDRLASHFKQATTFGIFTADGQQVATLVNPSPEQGCRGREQLLVEFERHQVARVFTKNMGQNMLGELLDKGYQVAKVGRGRVSIKSLFPNSKHLQVYTDASEGRPSLHSDDKPLIQAMTLTPVKQCCRTKSQLTLGQRRRG
ncbi:NifB/NifX family molybdenum-iron cluster-binding protein [Ferrimonas lipolytica]|uniref:Dinitrogenase iron-molybdenum cofactor biosynthesis domain-containing protein n=1 Tax=Ferrimonas lipolytica TaxID=2724191 RepID=A0A6H1UBP4_9GAMM|nr:NifB/NifX family molybdenum-iron cluster-binding protein [Ferrimonas lipolytica]QIZ76069.1 hypothetical protein HER31_03700 [Ferrimonas lipolytica]